MQNIPVIDITKGRPCGSCTACCHVLAVADLQKPYNCDCVHLKDGCTIYDKRPQGCREFECAWRVGWFGDSTDFRPDNCGFLLNLEDQDGIWLDIYETEPNTLFHILNRRRILELLTFVEQKLSPDKLTGARLFRFDARISAAFEQNKEVYGTKCRTGQRDFVGLGRIFVFCDDAKEAQEFIQSRS